MTVEALATVVKRVVVPAPPERAFAVFTERMGEWWPLATHSIHGDGAATVVVDGERVYEVATSGEEATWGRILVLEPPHRIVFTWEVTEAATEVEVRFVADGDGTRVELEHRGWRALGETAAEKRDRYDGGWEVVLGRYVDAV